MEAWTEARIAHAARHSQLLAESGAVLSVPMYAELEPAQIETVAAELAAAVARVGSS